MVTSTKSQRLFELVLFCCFVAQIVVLVLTVRRWPIFSDNSSMAYVGERLSQGARPYLDVFDNNLPGSYLFSLIVYDVFGPTNLAMRAADLMCVALLSSLAYHVTRSFFNNQRAWLVVPILLSVYLNGGPYFAAQRDMYLMIPVLVAVALSNRRRRSALLLTAFTIGVLLGSAATVKPNVLIFAPLLGLWLVYRQGLLNRAGLGRSIWAACAAAAGTVLPIFAAALWLNSLGSLNELLYLLRESFPLYAALGPRLTPENWLQIAAHIPESLQQPLGLIMIGGLLALFIVRRRSHSSQILFWSIFVLCAFIYVFAARKLWTYHWWPMAIGLAVVVSLLPYPTFQKRYRVTPVNISWLFTVIFIVVAGTFFPAVSTPLLPRLEAMEAFKTPQTILDCLSTKRIPGDTFQTLGNFNNIFDVLYRLDQPTVSRYYYDVQFYYQIDSTFTQRARNEFMTALLNNPPTWIIEDFISAPLNQIKRRTSFPELYRFIATQYNIECTAGTSDGEIFLFHHR